MSTATVCCAHSANRPLGSAIDGTSRRRHIFSGRRGVQVFAVAAPPAARPTLPEHGSSSKGSIPSLAPPAPAPAAPLLLPPPAAYLKAVETGSAKAALPAAKIFVMAVLAGVYIGFGAFLTMQVGALCPGLVSSNPGLQKMVAGAFGLPFGLLMVLICGAELFTGNLALITVALYEGKASLRNLIKNWTVSYVGNLVGSLLLATLVFATGLLSTSQAPLASAALKTSQPFAQAFTRGVLANWLVCLAVWQAGACNTLASKLVGIWFPISAFVAMGLEHSVANMFYIPMGILCGSPVTWTQFLTANLLPVTLGNMVGGIVCVASAYYFCFGGRPNVMVAQKQLDARMQRISLEANLEGRLEGSAP